MPRHHVDIENALARSATPNLEEHMITVRSSRAWSWTSIAALGGVSVALLVASLAAPERLGTMLVAPGLIGLFGLRLITLHRGWPPRQISGCVT